jgi:hypothetical protein
MQCNYHCNSNNNSIVVIFYRGLYRKSMFVCARCPFGWRTVKSMDARVWSRAHYPCPCRRAADVAVACPTRPSGPGPGRSRDNAPLRARARHVQQDFNFFRVKQANSEASACRAPEFAPNRKGAAGGPAGRAAARPVRSPSLPPRPGAGAEPLRRAGPAGLPVGVPSLPPRPGAEPTRRAGPAGGSREGGGPGGTRSEPA